MQTDRSRAHSYFKITKWSSSSGERAVAGKGDKKKKNKKEKKKKKVGKANSHSFGLSK
jgi:hypothetical protein